MIHCRRLLCIAAVVLVSVSPRVYATADENLDFYENLKRAFTTVEKETGITNTTDISNLDDITQGTKFDCNQFPHDKASNVNELTPYDIKVIGALGDSITAAMGARASNIIEDLLTYPGVSWSIGGDETLSTKLADIIREYNPDVKGYSVGIGNFNRKFNVAKVGAIAQNMPSQAEELVKRIKNDKDIDFDNDWKLVTLWIGGNNLCSYCNNKEKHSLTNYVDNIKEALDILHTNLPRTFVNLVQIIDVTRLEPLQTVICRIVHWAVCKCINDPETSAMSTEYQEGLSDLISSGRYDTKSDFTVVIQPFFEGVELPYKDGKPDMSYFAPDCFHFSTKGHMEGTKALWQNMFEPVGSKTSGWELGGPLYCPTEDNKYFYTRKNSPPPSSLEQSQKTTTTNDDTHRSTVALVTGTTVGVVAFVILVVIVSLTVVYKLRKRNRQLQVERLPLVTKY